MKLVREHINEKFSEKSDPIQDMGIGKINFREEFAKKYKIPETKLYDEWRKWVYQFKGMWIEGTFHRYGALNKVEYEPEPVHAKVKFTAITMNNEGILNLQVEGGITYCIIKGESYQISDK